MAGLKEAKELGPRMDALEEKFDALIDVLKKELNKPTPAPKIPEPKPDPRIGEIVMELGELREEIKKTAAAIPQPTEKKTTAADIKEDLIIALVIAALLFVFSYTGAKFGGVDDVKKKLNDTQYTVNQLYDRYVKDHPKAQQ